MCEEDLVQTYLPVADQDYNHGVAGYLFDGVEIPWSIDSGQATRPHPFAGAGTPSLDCPAPGLDLLDALLPPGLKEVVLILRGLGRTFSVTAARPGAIGDAVGDAEDVAAERVRDAHQSLPEGTLAGPVERLRVCDHALRSSVGVN